MEYGATLDVLSNYDMSSSKNEMMRMTTTNDTKTTKNNSAVLQIENFEV